MMGVKHGTIVVSSRSCSSSKAKIAPCLHLIEGCMFAGKSTELLRRSRLYEHMGHPVIYFTPQMDHRSGMSILTHAGATMPAVSFDSVEGLKAHMEKNKDVFVVCIDEAQFVQDLQACVSYLLARGTCIILSGLSGDFRMQPFPCMANIRSRCDTVTTLYALCSECNDGTPAAFTKRMSTLEAQVVVGGSETYRAVCRKHHS